MFKLVVGVAALDFLISSTVPSLGQSTIDPTIPAQGSPLTPAPIRENFAHAADDVNSLQASVAALRALIEAAISSGFVKDSHGTPIVGADQNPGYFGFPLAIYGTSGSQNSLVGEVTNNLAKPTFSLPTGITGYGKGIKRLAFMASENLRPQQVVLLSAENSPLAIYPAARPT
jgi:hypothetical protein